MAFTILNVAYPLAPVGPDAIGGAEQILTQLDAALVHSGHRSIVVASEDSITAGTLVPTPAIDGPLDDAARRKSHQVHRETISRAIQEYGIDLVHLHGIDFAEYVPEAEVPVVITLHLPLDWYAREIFHMQRPHTYLHCVSAAQRRARPAGAKLLPDIENGVSFGDFVPKRAKRRYVIALGRICPEKGFHLALDAAHLAGTSLALAGRVYPYPDHERYFREQIAPKLDRRRRFIGPVVGKKKAHLLAAARCLLAPSLVPETSCLVAMEALSCGTPVVAFPSGCLAELIEHGKTGFLVQNVTEMAEAIKAAADLKPADCRDAARTRFSLSRMTGQYLDMYGRIITRQNIVYVD